MATQILPAASLRDIPRLPAARVLIWASNHLIWMVVMVDRTGDLPRRSRMFSLLSGGRARRCRYATGRNALRRKRRKADHITEMRSTGEGRGMLSVAYQPSRNRVSRGGRKTVGSYLVRRFGLMLLTLFGISVIIFLMLRLAPGNIADILFDAAGFVDPTEKAQIMKRSRSRQVASGAIRELDRRPGAGRSRFLLRHRPAGYSGDPAAHPDHRQDRRAGADLRRGDRDPARRDQRRQAEYPPRLCFARVFACPRCRCRPSGSDCWS